MSLIDNHRKPRLRLFAGPNGSGKSTLFKHITAQFPRLRMGFYVNADDFQKELEAGRSIDFSRFEIVATQSELLEFASLSGRQIQPEFTHFDWKNGHEITLPAAFVNAYSAALIADFIREKLLRARQSISFESVMSHPSKVDFLHQARLEGYRIYLYFVATESPEINLDRVANRVKKGGHSVPDEKIFDRYQRTLALLSEAIKASDRAFIFDNTFELEMIAEITDGKSVGLETGWEPHWFRQYFSGPNH